MGKPVAKPSSAVRLNCEIAKDVGEFRHTIREIAWGHTRGDLLLRSITMREVPCGASRLAAKAWFGRLCLPQPAKGRSQGECRANLTGTNQLNTAVRDRRTIRDTVIETARNLSSCASSIRVWAIIGSLTLANACGSLLRSMLGEQFGAFTQDAIDNSREPVVGRCMSRKGDHPTTYATNLR
jgi:hypothetical protein